MLGAAFAIIKNKILTLNKYSHLQFWGATIRTESKFGSFLLCRLSVL